MLLNDTIIFKDDKQKQSFYNFVDALPSNRKDCYHISLLYCLTLNTACVEHFDEIYDMNEFSIKPQCLCEPWQTGSSLRTTRMAFQLFNGFTMDCDNNELISNPSNYTIDALFYSDIEYYCEAIKIRYLYQFKDLIY